ncbi:MAG: winged helix-turn-helix transcriptional regulator [Promethearchaeota archaeon]
MDRPKELHKKKGMFVLLITFLSAIMIFGSFTPSVAQGEDSHQKIGQQQPGTQFYQFENNVQFNLSGTAALGFQFQYEEAVENRFLGVQVFNTDEVNISISVSSSFQMEPTYHFMNKYQQGTGPSSAIAPQSEAQIPVSQGTNTLPIPEEVDIEDYEITASYHTYFTVDIEGGLENLQSISFYTHLDSELGLAKTDEQYLYWTIYDNTTEMWSLTTTEEEDANLLTSISAETLASGQVVLSLVELTPVSAPLFSSSLGIFLIIGVVLISAVGLMMTTEEYRSYLLNRFLPLNKGPHRLSMEQVLENETRGGIIDIILETPGVHFNQLLRQMSISAGTLAWHLDILETFKIIKKERVGQYLVYFSYLDANPLENMDFKLQKSQTTLEIVRLIRENPGIYQNQLAKKLKLNHKTVKYHLNKLLDIHLIYFKMDGRKRLYYGI